MRPRTLFVTLLAAASLVAPAGAEPRPGLGTASAYGLSKGFQQVGYTSLGARGMNSPLAVAGRCAYVGDRYYSTSSSNPGRAKGGIAIVDISNPARPTQRGVIPPVALATQRELRADAALGILVVQNYSPLIGAPSGTSVNNLKIYDIRDCLKPRLLSTYDFGSRQPHEFFLWKDSKRPGRALAYVTFTVFAPDIMVIDLTVPTAPALVGVYDLGVDQTRKTVDFVNQSGSGYTHSLAVSPDGREAYVAGWDYGFWTLDTSMLADPPAGGAGLVRPAGVGSLDYGRNVHSAVVIPGRDDVLFTQEDYANAGHGCPFGILRTGRLTADGGATLLGQFSLPENDPKTCGRKNGTFTAHNPTVFRDLALVTWYSGGLRAIDLSDTSRLRETGVFVPRPTFTPDLRDARLFFPRRDTAGTLPTDSDKPGSSAEPWTGAMWSYPVVQNGLIYVVDIDLGLYVLRYTGRHSNHVRAVRFAEGNSSGQAAPRGAAAWQQIAASRSPVTVVSPYRATDVRTLAEAGFVCM